MRYRGLVNITPITFSIRIAIALPLAVLRVSRVMIFISRPIWINFDWENTGESGDHDFSGEIDHKKYNRLLDSITPN